MQNREKTAFRLRLAKFNIDIINKVIMRRKKIRNEVYGDRLPSLVFSLSLKELATILLEVRRQPNLRFAKK